MNIAVREPDDLPCLIVIEPVGIELRNDSLDARVPVVRLRSGRFVSTSYHPGTLLLWDDGGVLIGRTSIPLGDGPGEIRGRIRALHVDAADSIHIGSDDGRWSVLDRTLALRRQLGAPAGGLLANPGGFRFAEDGTALVGGPTPYDPVAGEILRVSRDGEILDVVVPTDPAVLALGRPRAIALRGDGTLWTVTPGGTELNLVGPTGVVLETLFREYAWLPRNPDRPLGHGESGWERPYTYRIDEDAAGRVWLRTIVPASQAVESSAGFSPGGTPIMVEVIDPLRGAMIAKTSFAFGEAFPERPLGEGLSYRSGEDPDGTPFVEIVRFRLVPSRAPPP